MSNSWRCYFNLNEIPINLNIVTNGAMIILIATLVYLNRLLFLLFFSLTNVDKPAKLYYFVLVFTLYTPVYYFRSRILF